MKELIIYEFQAKTIENALRLAMNVLDSRSKKNQTAMDRELLRADEFIKSVLATPPPDAEKMAEALRGLLYGHHIHMRFDSIKDQHKYNEAVRAAKAALEPHP